MRTIHRYEAKDISPENKIHTAFMAGITLAMLQLRGSSTETIMDDMRVAIAAFLNMLSDMEIDVVDREQIPAVFRSGFPDDDRR